MKLLFIVFVVIFSGIAYSQNCAVLLEPLKGTYEGDCKKNKADGKGTAAGEDTYTGEFKAGLPDGFGKYVWKNGDWYEGQWKKGLREGQGKMFYADKKDKDSLQTGFWKKDKYIGKYEKPWIIHNKTPDVSRVDVTHSGQTALNEIVLSIESTSGGATTLTSIPKITITDITILSGQYMNRVDNKNLPKTFIATLKDVRFPFRARFSMGSDLLEMEFLENGTYKVELRINK
jgi:hypothetical protein